MFDAQKDKKKMHGDTEPLLGRRDRRSVGWITNHINVGMCVCMCMWMKEQNSDSMQQQRCQNQQSKCNKERYNFSSSGECAEFQKRHDYRRQKHKQSTYLYMARKRNVHMHHIQTHQCRHDYLFHPLSLSLFLSLSTSCSMYTYFVVCHVTFGFYF